MLVAVLAFLAVISANREYSLHDKNSDKLIKSLRERLLENNYDYMSNESKDNINLRAKSDEETSTILGSTTRNHQTDQINTEKQLYKDLQRKDNLYLMKDPQVARHNETDVSYDVVDNNNGHVISKNDLLYYIDDHHFVSQSGVITKKYEVLKLKHKSRRSGAGRLIQEEGKDGIAIVNLGGGPFPEFRLPRSRRQYMHDHGQVDVDEEEVSPPDSDAVVNNPYIADVLK